MLSISRLAVGRAALFSSEPQDATTSTSSFVIIVMGISPNVVVIMILSSSRMIHFTKGRI